MSRTQEFWQGIKDEIPILFGVFPFGIIYGTLALGSGLTPLPAQMMSSMVFAGSSQFITTKLLESAAPGAVIVLTIMIVNLRHVLYSASIAPYLQKLPTRWKALLAYLLTDEAYAVSILKYQRDGVQQFSHYHLLGSGLALWTSWQLSTAVGIFLGVQLPSYLPLDFAIPLTFIAMVVPVLKERASFAAALAAGVTAILAFSFPYRAGLIVAALVGITVGLALDNGKQAQTPEREAE